jgi:3-deoxy-D-manno-octulosonic-acid transferase
MTRWLYSCLMWLAQPFYRAKLKRRGQAEPGYLVAPQERFGRYGHLPAPAAGFVWVHAVSLGEARTAGILIQRLRERSPGMRLLLTHTTATGRAEGARWLRAGDVQVWAPWDTPQAVRRFLGRFKPVVGVLIETEVWPNMAAACWQMHMPLVLANARLSDKSLRQARRLAWLARPAYRSLAAVWAQAEGDATRLTAMGAKVQGVFGNLKFDAQPDAAQLAQGRAWRAALARPVLMFASSREGEEAAFLDILEGKVPIALVGCALLDIKTIANNIQWLIVPRHPQRFDEVAALIERHGFKASRRSDWGDAPAQQAADAQPPVVWLGDSLGEMALYYGLADCALLGGSFEPLGGQNLIEAAACGCPVLMGPHTFNFTQAAELADKAGAAIRVADLALAVSAAMDLVGDAAKLSAARQGAAAFASAHQGAADRLADAITQMLGHTRS